MGGGQFGGGVRFGGGGGGGGGGQGHDGCEYGEVKLL